MIIPGNTHELKVVPCKLTSGKPSTFPSKRVDSSGRGVRGPRFGRGHAGGGCLQAARSLSFYSHCLLTFDLNGVALLKFKRNKYRRNGIKLGYRTKKTVLKWPSLSSRRSNKNSKHSSFDSCFEIYIRLTRKGAYYSREREIDIETYTYRRIVIVLGRNGTK